MKCIRRAAQMDAGAIFELRLEAFSRATEFKLLDSESLRWSEQDDSEVVLAAWESSDSAVATIRGGLLLDIYRAEERMECSVPIDASAFPALLLGKGATKSGYTSSGLHSAIRYLFLSAIMDTDIKSVLGIVYANAPRTRMMQALGYEFLVPKRFWYTDLEPYEATLVAYLEHSKIGSACSALEERVAPLLTEYPYLGEPIRFTG